MIDFNAIARVTIAYGLLCFCCGLPVGALLVAAYDPACSSTLTEEHAERAHYCEMVRTHAWPDYRHTYQEECINHATEQKP